MADGTRKAIETLVPGDLLRGHTSDNRVLSLETPKLGERKLYRINGSKAFVTAEHPFLTKDGWKSIDPLSTAKEHASLGVKSLQVGDILITEQGESAVTSIEGATDDAERIVYNPQLTGDHTYYADGLLAHNKKDDCVRADSLVTRADGSQIAIDQVKVGDRLKGPEGDVEVTQISRIEGDAYVFYRINDLKFRITGSHPLQTTDGWKELDAEGRHADSIVGRLEVGDKLVGKDGTTIEVKRIEVDPGKGGTETAVNISTRDDKPFFVGDIIIKPFNEIEFSF